MSGTRAIIVDDHDIVRYALKHLFEVHAKTVPIEIIAEASNGRRAVELVEQLQPELVILDITLPESCGIEAARRIRSACPDCRIIILCSHTRRQYLRELIKIGFSGYVLKSRVIEDFFDAINAALRGEVFLSPGAAVTMANDYADIITGKHKKLQEHSLSSRQREVLQLLAEGKATKEIAAILGVSSKAIESVRHRLMLKLKIDNLADLTKYAIQEGLTTLDYTTQSHETIV